MGKYFIIGLLTLIVHIVLSVKFGKIAEERGHDALTYGCICFFLGVIGCCLVAALPDLHMQQMLSSIESKLNQLEGQVHNRQAAPDPEVPSQAATDPKPNISDKVLTPTVSANGEIICPTCNTKQMAGRKVCWSCGQKFIASQSDIPEE